jgi:hypothetical protein
MGAYDYKMADEALRVKAKSTKGNPSSENVTITVGVNGHRQYYCGANTVVMLFIVNNS